MSKNGDFTLNLLLLFHLNYLCIFTVVKMALDVESNA
jgi:hypothetical protein